MDLRYTDAQRAFRDEVRAYLAEALPARLSDKVRRGMTLTKADHEDWHAILHAQGWLAGPWPKEFGGAGWGAVERHIFEDEMTRAAAPRIVPFGLAMLGQGAESSMLKIKGSVLRQEITALTRQAAGPYAMPFAAEALEDGSNMEHAGPDHAMPATRQYFNNRKLSIYGGSNEIQRTIIAKSLLEL